VSVVIAPIGVERKGEKTIVLWAYSRAGRLRGRAGVLVGVLKRRWKFKTPNDEENLKEIKDEKMKWLYSTLRRESIIVLDPARKPPVWTFDKRVEIPEKALEMAKEQESQGAEEAEMEDVGEYEKYGEM